MNSASFFLATHLLGSILSLDIVENYYLTLKELMFCNSYLAGYDEACDVSTHWRFPYGAI